MIEFAVTTQTSEAGVTIVSVSGEVDLATVPELQAALNAVSGDATVDLAGVSFMDSTGLSALIAAQNHTVGSGHRFTVINESELVARTMTIAGVYDLLHADDLAPD